jgi:hypothetical protein
MQHTLTLLSALLLAPLAAIPAAPEPSLIAHWSFDEGSGVVLHDRSGNKHDGTIHGATWVPSPRGQALHFDGVDNYVDCGDAESLQLRGDPRPYPNGAVPSLFS